MTQNKFLVILVIFLLVSNLALIFFYVLPRGDHGKPEQPEAKPAGDYMQRELGLSDSQAAQFKALRDEHKSLVKPMWDSMRSMKNEFYDFLRQDAISDTLLESRATAIGMQQAALELKLYHHFDKLRHICSESQKPKFDSMVYRFVNRPWSKKKDKK